jgi:hypothetical protein
MELRAIHESKSRCIKVFTQVPSTSTYRSSTVLLNISSLNYVLREICCLQGFRLLRLGFYFSIMLVLPLPANRWEHRRVSSMNCIIISVFWKFLLTKTCVVKLVQNPLIPPIISKTQIYEFLILFIQIILNINHFSGKYRFEINVS